jgi:formylglycine-generating enzyme required for sulfatase activity
MERLRRFKTIALSAVAAVCLIAGLTMTTISPAKAQSNEALEFARAVNCTKLTAFLQQYPNGQFAERARSAQRAKRCPDPQEATRRAQREAADAKERTKALEDQLEQARRDRIAAEDRARKSAQNTPPAPTPLPIPGPSPAPSVVQRAPITTGGDRLAAFARFRDCDVCPDMVVIPAGNFLMGSPENELGRASDEGPQRRVSINRFAAGRFEVTFEDWVACVAGGGCGANTNPSDGQWGRGRRPVINVTWNDAQAYAQWLSQRTGARYRLFTEAEWEYAARAGTTTMWWFGNSLTPQDAQYGRGSSFGMRVYSAGPDQTAPVGSYRANPWGLYDTVGNTNEWVQDCYVNTFAEAPTTAVAVSPPGACAQRVLRGGSWLLGPDSNRSAARDFIDGAQRSTRIGFRIARELR